MNISRIIIFIFRRNRAKECVLQRSLRFVCPLFILLFITGFCLESVHAQQWNSFHTKFLKLRYQSKEDLKKFDKKIKYSGDGSSFSSFFGSSSAKKGFKKKMAAKLDAMFEKVQLILDMRKPYKVIVNIYPDETSLHAAYFKIYKSKKKLRAWYIFKYNTIYINIKDLSDRMLAHECAHAIVDNYLDVRPPRATAEILARYVDDHLYQKAKTY